MSTPKQPPKPLTFGPGDRDPQFPAGTIAVVHYGDYRSNIIFMADGANDGNWYPIAGPYGRRPSIEEITGDRNVHPEWRHLTRLGPVTILTGSQEETWQAGWNAGRRDLVTQIADLADEYAPQMPAPEVVRVRQWGVRDEDGNVHVLQPRHGRPVDADEAELQATIMRLNVDRKARPVRRHIDPDNPDESEDANPFGELYAMDWNPSEEAQRNARLFMSLFPYGEQPS